MGEMADYYTDIAQMYADEYGESITDAAVVSEEIAKIKKQYHKGKLRWESKDGSKKLISEMDNSHALNCLNLLTRRKKDAGELKVMMLDCYREIFTLELTKRGASLYEEKKAKGDYQVF